MATFALTNEYVEINSVDLSSHVKSAVLTLDGAQLDDTAMGDDWTSMIGGLKSGTLAITFNDDFDASAVDDTLWPLFNTVTTFVVRPDAGSASGTNPEYSGSILVSQHALGGQVGDLASKQLTFQTSGTVSRETS
ncbi:MAG: radical SAM protein [Actinomycetota bacterium]